MISVTTEIHSRLHLVFENVVRSGMDSTSGQLLHAQVVLNILDSQARYKGIQWNDQKYFLK